MWFENSWCRQIYLSYTCETQTESCAIKFWLMQTWKKVWFDCSLRFYVSGLIKTTAVWNNVIKKRLWKLLIELSVVNASLARIRLSKS